MDALMHYVGYAYATRARKLRWKLQPPATTNQLTGSFDASIANNVGARSQIGHILMLNGAPISWSSRANNLVNLSTNSSETYAGADAVQDITYVRNVLDFIGYGQTDPSPLGTDSTGALAFFDGDKTSGKNRSYHIRIFYLREKCHDGTAVLYKVDTSANLSDMMTKSLFRPKHVEHLDNLVYIVHTADLAAEESTTEPIPTVLVVHNINEVPANLEFYAISTRQWIEMRDMLVAV
jgi:hypothetical protein